MSNLLNGKELAELLKVELVKKIGKLKKTKTTKLNFASIVIGKDPASLIYAKSQEKLAKELGINYVLINEPLSATEQKLKKVIEKLKKDDVAGIIVQTPVPENIDYMRVIKMIGPDRDVEGLHPHNVANFFSGDYSIAPCTALAVMELLKWKRIDLRGKECVIIGHSCIIGKPLCWMMLDKLATVRICHIATNQAGMLKEHIMSAEILVTAVGSESFMIPGNWIKDKAVIIDVATKKINGKITGDVDFDSAKHNALYITPVPGGVGPVTNIILMRNFINLYKNFTGKIK